jgi:hypothetical protein
MLSKRQGGHLVIGEQGYIWKMTPVTAYGLVARSRAHLWLMPRLRKAGGMRMSKLRMKAAGAVVSVLLLLGSTTGQGRVLCFGADGHIAIESAIHGPCHDWGDRSGHSSATEPDDAESRILKPNCGPCSDIGINGFLEPRQKSSTSGASLARSPETTSAANAIPISQPVPSVLYGAQRQPSFEPTWFASKRGIVLLL